MTPERHRQIGDLYHAALALPSEGRAAFLDTASRGDSDLRREVESLLLAHREAGGFIATPVLGTHIPFAHLTAPSLIGQRFAHYEVLAQIGAGGMGEVYRARDAKLGRDVAIKILPRLFVDDPDRRARFDREARLLAALNHPHIGAIYGVEESGGVTALVLELVDGETLADRIARGPIASGEALNIAGQIADALDAAHSHGIIHRDLKPANIKITSAGIVKVLDFGLAKASISGASGPDPAQSPPIEIGGTRDGVILGTAAYMSPEQARAKPVDKRTDIWSFGCVLYEMLTGRTAFEGETLPDLLAAILDRDPDWQALPAATPDRIRDLLRHSLQKDPHLRLRDIGDARLDLDAAHRADARAGAATPIVSRRERLAWMTAGVMAIAAVAIIAWISRRPGSIAIAPEMRVEITTPPTTDPVSLEISPDGQTVVFVAPFEGRPRLWLRRLDAVSARPLAGTDLAALPFWSPDGRSLGFFANQRVNRIDLDGGRVQALARVEVGLGGTWTRGGEILFSGRTAGPIMRVADSGGEPKPVTEVHPPQFGHRFPQMLPDGRHVLFYVAGTPDTSGVYVARLDGSETRRVFPADSAAVYASSGHLLFIRQGTLYAQRFDPVTLAIGGSPFSVAERVTLESRFGRPALSAATTGPIIYRGTGTGGRNNFVWFDRTGRATGTLGERSDLDASHAALSPDTRHVAISRTVAGNTDIWLLNTSRDNFSKFTSDPGSEIFPLWSPDGSRIAYGTQQAGLVGSDLSEKSIAGSDSHALFTAATAGLSNALPDDWSPDGRFIVFREIGPKSGYDLWALPVQPIGKPFPLVQTEFEEGGGQFSPDGKWIAYQSDESGRSEIYVQPFPGLGARTPVSTAGGTQVRWNRAGRELFYIALDGRMMAVPIRIASDGKALDAAAPSALFTTRILGGLPGQGNYRQQYMVSPDGQRFLIQSVVQEDTSPIIVILNWKAGS